MMQGLTTTGTKTLKTATMQYKTLGKSGRNEWVPVLLGFQTCSELSFYTTPGTGIGPLTPPSMNRRTQQPIQINIFTGQRYPAQIQPGASLNTMHPNLA